MAKILYLHGIGSGPMSHTPRLLREALPEDTVIAPEIPIRPKEAWEFLMDSYNMAEDIDLVVGTSLGGFYAMCLGWLDKLLINPAMFADEDIRSSIGLGEQPFFNERSDGAKTYVIDENFLSELREIRERIYSDRDLWYPDRLNVNALNHTWAMFGNGDPMFSHHDDFCRFFLPDHASWFEGAHRLEKENIDRDVVPVIRKILTGPTAPFIEVFPDD